MKKSDVEPLSSSISYGVRITTLPRGMAQLPSSCFGFLPLMEFDQWTIGLGQGLSISPFFFFSGSSCDSSQPHLPFSLIFRGEGKGLLTWKDGKNPLKSHVESICRLSRPSSPGSSFLVTTMSNPSGNPQLCWLPSIPSVLSRPVFFRDWDGISSWIRAHLSFHLHHPSPYPYPSGNPECTGFKDSITERRRGYSQ